MLDGIRVVGPWVVGDSVATRVGPAMSMEVWQDGKQRCSGTPTVVSMTAPVIAGYIALL